MTADAYHLTVTHPEGEGAYLGMFLALEDTNISVESIDYLNVYSTLTTWGDISDLKAGVRVFGKQNRLNISATKSMTGHLMGLQVLWEPLLVLKRFRKTLYTYY